MYRVPRLHVVLQMALMLELSWGARLEKCPIFQTTSPRTPCYLAVTRPQDGSPVPPFVYAFKLAQPRPAQPCPVLQSLDPTQPCYLPAGPAFTLDGPLPPDADTIQDYVTKSPANLTFPSPVFRLTPASRETSHHYTTFAPLQ